MNHLAILRFEDGDFYRGFPAILIIEDESDKVVGVLPPNLKIQELYKDSQDGNRASNSQDRKKTFKTDNATASEIEQETNEYTQNFQDNLNQWLNSDSFHPIREKLLEILSHIEEVRIIVQTENPQLWQIPWHCWNLFDPYPNVDVALSFSSFKPIKRRTLAEPRKKVRVLAIFGNSKNINVKADEEIWRQLELLHGDQVEVTRVPPKPDETLKRRELYETLWDEKGWDILFFAGHSQTVWYRDQAGVLEINESDSLSIPELRYALKSVIALGLKLAIFNSCDGLGLARNLADLQIPQVIVMREPIPDPVAKVFVEDFLNYFVNEGKSLYSAVRQTRESLRDMEADYPNASWLPVICQNPADEPLTWQGLLSGLTTDTNWQGCCRTRLALDAFERLNSNMVTNYKGKEIEDIYIPSNLGLLERPKLNERDQTQFLIPAEDYKITRNYQQHEFFEEVIKRRRSPKSRGSRLAIIGEPGTGKTLLLQRMGDWITWELDNTQQIVIWVSLAALERGQNLGDYLQQVWLPKATKQVKISWASPEALIQVFMTGKVWLLLDGADEMNVPGNPLAEIARQISELRWLTKARVVLTCRLNTWEANKDVLQHFDVYRNLDFTYSDRSYRVPDQVAAFIRRWFGDDVAKGERLRQEIEQEGKQRIKEMATNPLRLSLLCLVWEGLKESQQDNKQGTQAAHKNPTETTKETRQGGSLPETRAALYQRFVDEIYKWKEKIFRNEEGLSIGTNDKLVLNKKLATLARRAIEHNQTPLIKKLLPANAKTGLEPQNSPFRISHTLASSILDSDLRLALQLGWLNQVGVSTYHSEEPIYAFFHPTFHEYFAAISFNDKDWIGFLNHTNLLHPAYGNYRVFELQWQEVILLWFGRKDVLDAFKYQVIEALWSFEDRCNGFYRLQAKFIATTALAEIKEPQKDIATQIIEEVGRSSFMYFNNYDDYSFPYEAERKRALKALKQTDSELAKKFLLNQLNRVSGINRIALAFALEKFSPEHPLVIDTFLEYFLIANDADNRGVLFYAAQALIRATKEVKEVKAKAKVIETLIPLLKPDEDEEILAHAAMILGSIAGNDDMPKTKPVRKKAVDTFIKQLRESIDQDQVLKVYDYFEVISLENPAATKYIFEQLTKFLQDNQTEEAERNISLAEERRLCAAKALLEISPVSKLAVNVLLEIAWNNPTDSIDQRALDALRKLGNDNSTVITALCRSITELNENTLCVSNTELYEEQLTNYNNDRVLRRIIDILGEIAFANQVAIDTLSQRLDITQKVEQRLHIAGKLEQIDPGNEKAIATLQELMRFSQNNEKAIATLQELVRFSQNSEVRALAAQRLAEVDDLDDSEAIDVLISLLQTVYSKVLELVQQSDPNAEKPWELSFPLGLVKRIANRLSKIGQGNLKVISALTLLVEDEETPNEEVRFKAVESLLCIDPGSPIAINALMSFYRNAENEEDCQSAARELRNHLWDAEVSDRTRRRIIIQALSEIIQSCQDDQLRLDTARILGRFDSGNSLATATLVDLVKRRQDFRFSYLIEALKDIIQGSQAQKVAMEVVTSLKDILLVRHDETQTTDNNREQLKQLNKLLELFWVCSEVLSYPDFYCAWNLNT